MLGTCKLCLKQRPLKKSHLIPKAAYRAIGKRNSGGRSPYLLKVNGAGRDTISPSDKQVTQKLLCERCESLFSRREHKVARVWQTLGGFILWDELNKLAKNYFVISQNGIPFLEYPKGISIDEETLYYFAVSVVWRMVQDGWGYDIGEPIKSPDVIERMRKYLLGEGPRLDDVRFIVSVDHAGAIDKMLFTPYRYPCGGVQFLILGLLFQAVLNGDEADTRTITDTLRQDGLHIGLMLDSGKFASIEQNLVERHYRMNVGFRFQRREFKQDWPGF